MKKLNNIGKKWKQQKDLTNKKKAGTSLIITEI